MYLLTLVNFLDSESESTFPIRIRIRIQGSQINADPERQDLTVGADGELRLGGHDAPEDQRSAGGLGRSGGRNIRHSVQGILCRKPVLRVP